MRLLVNSIRDYAVFMLDPDGRVQTWNEGARRLKGYTEEEIVGESFVRFYPPEDAAAGKPARLLREARENGRVEDEGYRVRKDGTRFWADVVLTAIRGSEGELLGFAKVTRDLSERRDAEEKLRRSEERFRLMVEAVRDYAIFLLEPDGTIATWNEGAERINQYRPEEIIGKHFSIFYPEEDVRAGKCELELRIAREEGRYEEEGIRLRKDGTRFWASVLITSLWDSSGALYGFAKVTRDLTERRKAEAERTALAKATEAVRLRDEFLSIASHELKTPLTALQIQLQHLSLREGLEPAITKGLARAAKSGKRLADLIDALLEVGRITSGRLSLHPARVDLVALARDVLDRFREAAAEARCEVALRADAEVVGSWDPLRLEQVLVNLLSNALKYGAGAAVAVSVSQAGEWALLDVEDRGPGIAEADRERIFGRFERASSMRHYGGLGLGLFVARQIVEAHGGTIEAHSLERGTRFSVRIPKQPAGRLPEALE